MGFKKAVKYKARARVALIGPAGSGKTYTMLTLAKLLSADSGKVAVLDTEHGSASKYADLFDFFVEEPSTFSPELFIAKLTEAEQAGMDVFCCDSLSHFWIGKDGALEFVDERAKRQKDKMGGWKDFRPHERAMVDRMIASPCHIIVTMRTKTAYEEQVGDDGRKKRVKIGLAPVQREGLEYEFDLVGYMDDDNNFITDKTRCPAYAGKAMQRPGAKEFAPFVSWLDGAARVDVSEQDRERLRGLLRPRGADYTTTLLQLIGVASSKDIRRADVPLIEYLIQHLDTPLALTEWRGRYLDGEMALADLKPEEIEALRQRWASDLQGSLASA